MFFIFLVTIVGFILFFSLNNEPVMSTKYIVYEDEYQVELRLKREAKLKQQKEEETRKQQEFEKVKHNPELVQNYKILCDKIANHINTTISDNIRDVLNKHFIANQDKVIARLIKANTYVAGLPTPYEVYLYGAALLMNDDMYQWGRENSQQQKSKYSYSEPVKNVKLGLKDYCAVLELSLTPTEQQLKTAYRAAIRKCHPDLFASKSKQEQKQAEEKAHLINAAKDYIDMYFHYNQPIK